MLMTRAVVFTAPNKVEVQEVAIPDPDPGDVLVRTLTSWISNGTEGSYLRGERSDGDRPQREDDPPPFPVVAGYQKIGVVEWVGTDVFHVREGDTVFCTIGRVSDMHHWYGGQLELSVAPKEHVWSIPQHADPLTFSGLVLTQVGYNAGSRAPLPSDASLAVVVGDGLVGLWTTQTLLNRGARVILVGKHDYRLELAPRSDRLHSINSTQTNWVDEVIRNHGEEIAIGVDTVGSIKEMKNLMRVSRRFGHLVSAGFYGEQDCFSLQPPRYKELSIDLVSGWTRERMDETLDQVAEGKLTALEYITHRFPVERAADAWDLILSKREPVLGVLLDWDSNVN